MWWLVIAILTGPGQIARLEIGPMNSLVVCEQYLEGWFEAVPGLIVARCEKRT